jgi:hypothetical protein
VANTLKLHRCRPVGFIDWLDGSESWRKNLNKTSDQDDGEKSEISKIECAEPSRKKDELRIVESFVVFAPHSTHGKASSCFANARTGYISSAANVGSSIADVV